MAERKPLTRQPQDPTASASRRPQRSKPLLRRPAPERERIADEIADYLDPIMTALGVVFLLLVLAESLVDPQSPLQPFLAVAGWIIWAAFVAEFVFRIVVAPSTAEFLKRNWWQVLFLALPFLRFLRLLRALRFARAGRVVSSAMRAGRTATRNLRDRIVWLGVVTVIVVLASSQLLFEFGGFDEYVDALYSATLASVNGEPVQSENGIARLIGVFLSIYSVAVFASLAGALGAFYLEKRAEG